MGHPGCWFSNGSTGWGPLIGAPTEIAGALVNIVAALLAGRVARIRPFAIAAALAYVAMIATFFALNDPVNVAFSQWTPARMPADWRSYRDRWEAGHALAAALSAVAVICVLHNLILVERLRLPPPKAA